MEKGTRVRFTADHLGVLDGDSWKFAKDRTVGRGDEGTYLEPHAQLVEERWHLIELEDGAVVPVHISQFETV
jgi:hypothetical protein